MCGTAIRRGLGFGMGIAKNLSATNALRTMECTRIPPARRGRARDGGTDRPTVFSCLIRCPPGPARPPRSLFSGASGSAPAPPRASPTRAIYISTAQARAHTKVQTPNHKRKKLRKSHKRKSETSERRPLSLLTPLSILNRAPCLRRRAGPGPPCSRARPGPRRRARRRRQGRHR